MKVSTKDKNKKFLWPYYVIVGLCGVIVISILIGIVHINLFLNSLLQTFSHEQKANEAEKLIIPVLAYAQSQEWKSVRIINNPRGIDNNISEYNETFLTKQSTSEVEQMMLTFFKKGGYRIETTIINPGMLIQPITNGYYDTNLGFSYLVLSGTDIKGNTVYVTINNKGYEKSDGSIVKIPEGTTAVFVASDYYGYEKQKEKEPVPSAACVGDCNN